MSYTKRELIEELAGKCKLSRRRVDSLLTELSQIAYREAGNGFTVPGICRLDVVRRKERRARNPRTGETLLIGEHDVLRVRPVKRAKQMVAPTPPDLVTVLPADQAAMAEAAFAAGSPVAAAEAAMALFSFRCPFCRAEIEVSTDCVGERINCPACGRGFTAPPVGQQPRLPEVRPTAPAARPVPTAPAATSAATPAATPAAAPAAAPAGTEEHFVSFTCKSCGQEIEAPIDMAGSHDECPACGAAITVPYLSEPGTSQALQADKAEATLIEAAKSRTLRIELPDDI